MKLDFLNRVSGVRIPPSAPSKALRKECFLFVSMAMARQSEMRNDGGGFAAIEGSGRSCSGIRYLTYDVSRRSG